MERGIRNDYEEVYWNDEQYKYSVAVDEFVFTGTCERKYAQLSGLRWTQRFAQRSWGVEVQSSNLCRQKKSAYPLPILKNIGSSFAKTLKKFITESNTLRQHYKACVAVMYSHSHSIVISTTHWIIYMNVFPTSIQSLLPFLTLFLLHCSMFSNHSSSHTNLQLGDSSMHYANITSY